jgi:hypothetical protein
MGLFFYRSGKAASASEPVYGCHRWMLPMLPKLVPVVSLSISNCHHTSNKQAKKTLDCVSTISYLECEMKLHFNNLCEKALTPGHTDDAA